MRSRLPKRRHQTGEILTSTDELGPSNIEVSLPQSQRPKSVSYTGIRYPLKQAAIFPDHVQGGIGFGKLETVAKCAPVADRGVNVHVPDTQPNVQVHGLPNGQFHGQGGRKSPFTDLKRSAGNGTH
jgi:hypothetical protein